MILYMYIGRGWQPQGTKYLCQQKPLVTSVICYKFKKNLFKVWFYTIVFIILYMYIGRGWQPQGTKYLCQQKPLVTSVICYKFKKNLFKVWFYTIVFIILYKNIAPGQGQTAPREQRFDVNRNVLSLHSFVASLKKMFLKSDFIQFFSWFNTCI